MPRTFLLLLLLAGWLGSAAAAPPPRRHVMGQGGNTATSGNHRAQTTVGQPVVGPMGSGSASNRAGIGFWYLVSSSGTATDVAPSPRAMPNRLDQNVPNPFNPVTTIAFSIAEAGPVRLNLYNLQGKRVATLVDEQLPAGEHSLVFRPTRLASGVYFYRLETAGYTQSRRLLLLK